MRSYPLITACVIALSASATSQASPITYATSGNVNGSDNGPVQFISTDPTFTLPGFLLLGHFQTPNLPSGSSLTYTNTPFTIDVTFYNGPGNSTSELELKGVLNGTLKGDDSSTLYASFTSSQQIGPGTLPFPIRTFTVPSPLLLVPFATHHGSTHVTAYVSYDPSKVAPVPEPTLLAMFGLAAAGTGIRRWKRRRNH